MLTTQDLLNIFVGFGFLILVGFASAALYQLALTLKSIRMITSEINKVEIGAFSLIKNLLGGWERR